MFRQHLGVRESPPSQSWHSVCALLGGLSVATVTSEATAQARRAPRLEMSAVPAVSRPAPATSALPSTLADTAYWRLVRGLSEPGGFFPSDNFTSNEMAVAQVAAALERSGRTGGAYLGVGPEQNFTYIAAVKPDIAFIVDIRRQAIVQQLMYKAIFETARDRAEFISILFSKPRPAGLDSSSSIRDIWDAYWQVRPDSALYARNLTTIKERLEETHRFTMSDQDLASLDYIYHAFFCLGPEISYSGYFAGSPPPSGGVNFVTLSMATDEQGMLRSFLSTEARYRVVRNLEVRNLIIPVLGDFGGPSAIRAVAAYLRAHQTPLAAFYVSNVEQYLFQSAEPWNAFYRSLATMPTTPSTVFIRPGLDPDPGAVPLCPMADYLAAYAQGKTKAYADAQDCVR